MFLEKTKFRKPGHAEGHICLELYDPITRRITEQRKVKNHVFEDLLFSGPSLDWAAMLNTAWVVLNDSTAAIDNDVPFILGQTLGYGVPSTAAGGTLRAGYVSATQQLGVCTLEKMSWIYAYDFSSSQAVGTIGTAGITTQFFSSANRPLTSFSKTTISGIYSATNDGRYVYVCSTAGIITKYDLYEGTSSTIDVSAIVGTTSSSYKTVGYNPVTGHYYINVYSSTSANRRVFEFADNTFSSAVNTYSPTNNTQPGSTSYPMYVYGTVAYFIVGQNIYAVDFSANTTPTTIAITTYNAACYYQNATFTLAGSLNYQTVPLGKYILCWGGDTDDQGILFDISTGTLAGWAVTPATYSSGPAGLAPISQNKMPIVAAGTFYTNGAVAAHLLDTPLVKPSNQGLLVTYQIDIYWE